MLALGNKIIAGSFKAGASWEVGDVGISAFGIDEALNKRRYLNGQVISQAQFVEFTAMLKSRVSVYPSLATTEVNWQAEVTNSALGQCGKFVIDDDAGTIRLPKVVNINGLQDLTGLGTIKAESLPNVWYSNGGYTSDPTIDGALTQNERWNVQQNESVSSTRFIAAYSFNASKCSSTYQDDAPVQQEAIQYPYFIQVAEGVETSVDVSREIELNNPFSLLDYKYSEYELDNASWLLSNGQFNSGSVYPAVYQLLLQELNGTSNKLPYRSYVSTIGNLVDTNGVLSGFAGGVYAIIDEVPYSTADSIEILLKTTTGTLDTSNYKCFYSPIVSNQRGVNLQVTPANKIQLYVSSNAGSSWDIVNGSVGNTTLQSNTQYYFKYVYTGTNHILYMSTTGAFAGEETTEVNVTNSGKPSNSAVSLGLQAWATAQGSSYWRGTIDLNESYININGKRWWTGRRKIVTSTVDYADTDFVLNTSDTTFRLPLKVALASGNKVVGNGMVLGLADRSNDTGEYTLGTYYPGVGSNVTMLTKLQTPDRDLANATSSGTYLSSGPLGISQNPNFSGIETSANGLYLYFYVGEVVQDANIIAAGQALTDIADLKSHYIVETYQNGENWYRLYSDGWCEQRIWCSVNGATNAWSYNIGNFQLLKEMKDTTYTVMLWSDRQHTNNGHAVTMGTKTTTNFKLNTYNCAVSGPALIFGYAKEE